MRERSVYRPGASSARSRSGFTLIEILIVGAIIALFAGLAIFAAQAFYQNTTRKAIQDETKSIGTALAHARDDVGFFPRLHLLGSLFSQLDPLGAVLRPGLDTYGFMVAGGRLADGRNVPFSEATWRPPYTSVVEARRLFAQGSRLLVKVRLIDPGTRSYSIPGSNEEVSLVDWPADIWGNPYVVYLVTDGGAPNQNTNPLGLRMISHPLENPKYWAAVVSYGPNGVPGGLDEDINIQQAGTAAYKQYKMDFLFNARLFVRGDTVTGTGVNRDRFAAQGQPVYTMKCANPEQASVGVDWVGDVAYGDASNPDPIYQQGLTSSMDIQSAGFLNVLSKSIYSNDDAADPDGLTIGIRDPLSDDLFWAF
jgi:prepilin-type N-terminal cleavage/methylation domain-containing protein